MRKTLGRLADKEDEPNVIRHARMAPMTRAMERLGMLEATDTQSGIRLGGTRYTVVPQTPLILQTCFETACNHYFPNVKCASDIPGYLESWGKFLDRLPTTLEVESDIAATCITGKILVWLRSSFLDALPTTVSDAEAWWPVGSHLSTSQHPVL